MSTTMFSESWSSKRHGSDRLVSLKATPGRGCVHFVLSAGNYAYKIKFKASDENADAAGRVLVDIAQDLLVLKKRGWELEYYLRPLLPRVNIFTTPEGQKVMQSCQCLRSLKALRAHANNVHALLGQNLESQLAPLMTHLEQYAAGRRRDQGLEALLASNPDMTGQQLLHAASAQGLLEPTDMDDLQPADVPIETAVESHLESLPNNYWL